MNLWPRSLRASRLSFRLATRVRELLRRRVPFGPNIHRRRHISLPSAAEVLEDRTLLAAASLDIDGVLTIDFTATGTTAENVTVTNTGANIVLTGNVTGTSSFTTADVERIEVTASGGSNAQSLTFAQNTDFNLPDGLNVVSGIEMTTLSVDVTTDGASVVFGGRVVLGASVVLTNTGSAAGDVDFAGALNADAASNNQALTVNSSGIVFLDRTVGGTAALGAITVSAARVEFGDVTARSIEVVSGVTNFKGDITTTGTTSMDNFVQIAGSSLMQVNTTIDTSAGNGDMTFGGRIEVTKKDVVLNAGDGTIAVQTIGRSSANRQANDVTITAGRLVFTSGTETGIFTTPLTGDAGDVVLNVDEIILTANTEFDTTSDNAPETADGNVTINGTIDAQTEGGQSLTIASDALVFNGFVGGTAALSNFSKIGPGLVEINGGGVTTTGPQSYTNSFGVRFGADGVMTSTTGELISFSKAVFSETSGAYSLTINGEAFFNFNVGQTQGSVDRPFSTLTFNGEASFNGGTPTFPTTTLTTGMQTYNGAVEVSIDRNFVVDGTANIVFNATLDSGATGAATRGSATFNTGGNVVFAGDVGGTVPLENLSFDDDVILDGVLTNTGRTIGDVTFSGLLALTTDFLQDEGTGTTTFNGVNV